MKFLLSITFVIIFSANNFANSFSLTNNENDKKTGERETKTSNKRSKNFHTIKRWKITITYTNGDKLVKSISVKGKTKLSAMEKAFLEAENYLKHLDNVDSYSVTPLANNEFVLLAEK
ncbi:hypothetical protein ACE939_05350 [Aquimarina sp. W85]|uniref:hypothetical protein n=1 Tax=Aquimarina rhodophyticola TaxID=3342246 RepID=UPI00366E092C